tara:strand:+ start:3807 stop:4352 length:546 start_codon:yes stop_codon:yes gene_type:complete
LIQKNYKIFYLKIRKMKRLLIIIFTLQLFISCKNKIIGSENFENNSNEGDVNLQINDSLKYLVIELKPNINSKAFGRVRFIQHNESVVMTAKVSGLSNGIYNFGIEGAKGVYKLENNENFIVQNKKITTIKFSTNRWCIGCKDKTKDILGKKIIIYNSTNNDIVKNSRNYNNRVSCSGMIE